MDTQDIDSIFRKAVENANDFYDVQAKEAKARIWKQIQEPRRKPKPLIVLMAAACIALLMLSSFLTISLLRTQKSVNNQAQIIRKLSQQPTSPVASIETRNDARTIQRTDTVYITKEKVVTIPIEVTKLKADTVYIDQVIYVEKEKTTKQENDATRPLNAESGEQSKRSYSNTQIYISDNENEKQGKKPRFKLRLGGEKNQENSGSLALTAKY